MRNIIKKPVIYISHAISQGGNIEANCEKAIRATQRLRAVFPEIFWYCPGEHDWAIQSLFKNKSISYKQIIEADLKILRESDGWIWYKFDESPGSTVEMDEAIRLGFCSEHSCIFTFDVGKANYAYLRKIFTPLVESAKKRFRGK